MPMGLINYTLLNNTGSIYNGATTTTYAKTPYPPISPKQEKLDLYGYP